MVVAAVMVVRSGVWVYGSDTYTHTYVNTFICTHAPIHDPHI